jgi:hypothetical protein
LRGGHRYREELRARAEREAGALSSLTGWPIDEIRRKMGSDHGAPAPDNRPWRLSADLPAPRPRLVYDGTWPLTLPLHGEGDLDAMVEVARHPVARGEPVLGFPLLSK